MDAVGVVSGGNEDVGGHHLVMVGDGNITTDVLFERKPVDVVGSVEL